MRDESKLTLQDYSEVSSSENPDLLASDNSVSTGFHLYREHDVKAVDKKINFI